MEMKRPFGADENEPQESGYNFGTFTGVYMPALLTILGLVMFMRMTFVIGNAGIFWTLAILFIGGTITLSTGLSIATISTNTRVRGGGAYFLISRVLGPSFGTTIGLTLFLSQSLSIPFNIIGASEAIVMHFGALRPYYLWLTLGIGTFVALTVWRGAAGAMRTQLIILVVMLLSILFMLIGPLTHTSIGTFDLNWERPESGVSLFTCFAVFFPAVTGIMAGVNMSGDLRNPHKSIPFGTITALLTAVGIYTVLILVAGSSFSLEEMVAHPYKILADNALFGWWGIVLVGVLAATISTAIGWMLGAPRVVQSLAQDGVLPILAPFGVGDKATNEPRRALVLVVIITFSTLVWGGIVGSDPEISPATSPVNTIASLVSLLFLFTYAIINLAAFVETLGSNPSFRPRFRFFHWSIALYGAVACIGAAFFIDFTLALIGSVALVLLYFWVRYRRIEMVAGDARRGFIYSTIHRLLLKLPQLPVHPKNWRPTAVVFCRDPLRHGNLIDYAVLFGGHRGILSVIQIEEPHPNIPLREQRNESLTALRKIAVSKKWPIFPEVVVSQDFDESLRILLQGHSLDPIKPNIAMLGWPRQTERIAPFLEHLRTIVDQFNLNSLILANGQPPLISSKNNAIDLWFENPQAGSLMLILAYLVQQNRNWRKSDIRIFFSPDNPLAAEMTEALEEARIRAQVVTIPKGTSTSDMLFTYSRSSQLIFVELVKYDIKDDHGQADLHGWVSRFDDTMPPVFLVTANGEADLFS